MSQLKRHLSLFSCTLLVAGNMIGIGIFVTAARLYNVLPHPGYIVLAWLIGGFLSVAGGLVYAELATRFPRAGGGYVFLKEAFGPLFGFLAGFSASLVTIPGTAAFLAMGFAKYAGISQALYAKGIGIALILVISYVNYRGVTRGAFLQNGFMVLKLALIGLLLLAGFASQNGSLMNLAQTGTLTLSLWVAVPLALVPIMYTYSGWDATVYVAGEVEHPKHTIPLSLFMGAFGVMLVYVGLALLYLYAIPVTQAGQQTAIVTAVSGVLFGPTVGKAIGFLVALSVLGCLSATILTGPRVLYAMAKDGYLPAFMAKVDGRYFTPAKAIWFHAVWACLLLLSGTFDQLLDYVTVPSVLFAALNGVGLFMLRSKNKADSNAQIYHMWGYPVLPFLFVVAMLGIVVNTAFKMPSQSLWGLAVVALGIPLYWATHYKKTLHLPYKVALEGDLDVIPAEWVRSEKPLLGHTAAIEAFIAMAKAAAKQNIELVIFSAYRSFEFQKNLLEDAERRHGKGKGSKWVAPAGYSEHHTGYVFDLGDKNYPEADDEAHFETTPAGIWLAQNAPSFGFYMSFPEHNWQGVGFEPWHWKYVGCQEAKQIFYPSILKKTAQIFKACLKAYGGDILKK